MDLYYIKNLSGHNSLLHWMKAAVRDLGYAWNPQQKRWGKLIDTDKVESEIHKLKCEHHLLTLEKKEL